MNSPAETIAIQDASDVLICRRRVAHLATALRFPLVQVGELAILVSELVENVLRHGGGRGQLSLTRITGAQGPGIEIVCTDGGPGFDAATLLCRWLLHGPGPWASAWARCAASPTPARCRQPPGGVGAMVIVRKWLPPAKGSAPVPADTSSMTQFDVGARSRPVPGYKVNGDAYVVCFPPTGPRPGGRDRWCWGTAWKPMKPRCKPGI